jgi:hypothetical protein
VIAGPVEATALGNVAVQAVASGHLPDLAAARALIAGSVAQQQYDPGPVGPWEGAFDRFGRLRLA